MDNQVHNQLDSFIWGIADDCLRDVYVRGKYRDVILPMTVIRRLDAMLEGTKQAVLDMKKTLDAAHIDNQWPALCNAAGQAFCNASPFLLRDLTSFTKRQTLKANFEAYLDGFSPNVQEILENTVNEYSVRNTRLASTIQVYREIITDLHGTCSKRNVRRLHSGELSPDSSSVIAELFAGYELIVDRCDSIASHILFDCEEKNHPLTEEQYEMIRDLFKDKYSELE